MMIRQPSAGRPRTARLFTLLVAAGLIATSCGFGGAQEGQVSGEAVDETGRETSGDSTVADETEPSDELIPGVKRQSVELPYVPPITLPDLSELDSVGEEIQGELGDYDGSGLDVTTVSCANGELEYPETSEGFLSVEVDADGSGSFENIGGGIVEIQLNADGSGYYKKVGGGITEITVNADGSGLYEQVGGEDGGIVEIEVNEDGSGRFESVRDGIVEIDINPDGSGYYKKVGGGITEITVNADGSGSFEGEGGDIELFEDGAIKFSGNDDGIVKLEVNADGSGSYKRVGDGIIEVTVDAEGNGLYTEVGEDDVEFQTDVGILDPRVVIAGPRPEFVVADRFPKLDKLGSIKPVCATVISIDDNVLFDFDSDQLRPTAEPILDDLAATLVQAGKPLEVQGHTDSKGEEAYNLALSQRRADAVADALKQRGVSTSITSTGLGETKPAAPNETEDGSDDPAGRQKNRRVEIVIRN